MAKKRITELATETTLKDGQYVAIDHTTDGTKKLNLGAELTDLKEDFTKLETVENSSVALIGAGVSTFSYTNGTSHSSTKDKVLINIPAGTKWTIYIDTTSGSYDGIEIFAIYTDGTSQSKGAYVKNTSYDDEKDIESIGLYMDALRETRIVTFYVIIEDLMWSSVDKLLPLVGLSSTKYTFINGHGVNWRTGQINTADSYSYADLWVAPFCGTTLKGFSGASDNNGIAFYDKNNNYISGFGNSIAGTYNWNINGIIPDNAVTAKIHCKIDYQNKFYLAFDFNDFVKNICSDFHDVDISLDDVIKKQNIISGDITFPKLRNGSTGNPSNGNAITTEFIEPIDFSVESYTIKYTGDTSKIDEFYFGYVKYKNATDGMTVSEAWSSPSVGKAQYNTDAAYPYPEEVTFDVSTFVGYDHIGIQLFAKKNGNYVPLRIATDQYNIAVIKNPSTQSYGDQEILSYIHNSKHVKGNANASTLSIAHFSDIHADTSALYRIMRDIEKYESLIDDTICTGDIVANSNEQIESWWDASVLTCIGNHDSASYSNGTYNWVALSMADRDAYYIAPFESNWGITHTSGTSYYYKDYADQKVRLIVLDVMIYSIYESDESLKTAQAAWLNGLLSDAITNDLHVLIATHAPHGGAVAEQCSFSKFGQGTMPTLGDCDTPQVIIDAVESAISSGLHFIGYLVGHTHQDNIWDAENNGHQMMYCITCAAVSQTAQWTNSDQYRSTSEDAYNIVTIDTTNTLVKIVRGGGANIDDHMRTRKAICIDYSTGSVVGEVL